MKKIKILAIIIASLIGCYLLYFVFIIVKYQHHTEMFKYKPYLWILNDSVKNDVETDKFAGFIRKRDILYEYVLKSHFHVSIWEFKDLSKISLNEVAVNSNIDLSEVRIMPYELLNKRANPEITIELGFSFNGSVSLNIGKQTKVIKSIDTPKYKGFYGLVNKLSLSNETGKHLIVFDYPSGNEPTVFLFYKSEKGFYVIFINSRNVPFDEHIIKLLNLS